LSHDARGKGSGRSSDPKDSLARQIAALDHVYATPTPGRSGGDHYRPPRALLDQLTPHNG
jgi:hypothetical protein